MIRSPRILLFDIGMGGLTVAQRGSRGAAAGAAGLCRRHRRLSLWRLGGGASDRAHAPGRGQAHRGGRPRSCGHRLQHGKHAGPDAAQGSLTLPFVGTVPAIKPAAAQTKSGIIGVLATPGTARREYTQALIQTYAYHCKVFLHGAQRLAEMAEAKLREKPSTSTELREEIQPVFRYREGKRTDTVVLGCTHYPLLLEDIEKAAPWPVDYIDPAPAIARRVADVLKQQSLGEQKRGPKTGTALFTAAPRTPRVSRPTGPWAFPGMRSSRFPFDFGPDGCRGPSSAEGCSSLPAVCLPVEGWLPSCAFAGRPVGRETGRGGRAS